MKEEPLEPSGIGEILRAARVAKGLNQQALARELRMPLHLLAALEVEDWKHVPPGRERPLARRVASHLGIDLSLHHEAWELLPGGVTQEAPDPAKERLERALMGGLTLGSVALFLWLVIPGRDIKGSASPRERRSGYTPMAVWVPRSPPPAYPGLGGALPEAPITSEGTLVGLRAMDACLGQIVGEGVNHSMPLRVSEPWILRVKGAFTLSLDNAGVVTVEVAGRRINHGRAVGESWSASFDAEGRLVLPVEETPKLPLHVPQTDPEAPVQE